MKKLFDFFKKKPKVPKNLQQYLPVYKEHWYKKHEKNNTTFFSRKIHIKNSII